MKNQKFSVDTALTMKHNFIFAESKYSEASVGMDSTVNDPSKRLAILFALRKVTYCRDV